MSLALFAAIAFVLGHSASHWRPLLIGSHHPSRSHLLPAKGDCGTAEYAFEESHMQLKVPAEWIGHQVITAEPPVYSVPLPVDKNKALGIAYGQSVEDDLIDERVDGLALA